MVTVVDDNIQCPWELVTMILSILNVQKYKYVVLYIDSTMCVYIQTLGCAP